MKKTKIKNLKLEIESLIILLNNALEIDYEEPYESMRYSEKVMTKQLVLSGQKRLESIIKGVKK